MGFFDRIFNAINEFIFAPSREDIRERAFEKRERDAELQREFPSFRQFQERVDTERIAEEIRDIDEKEVEEEEEIFFRKMVKTGKSGKDTRKIFAYTFERAYQPTREDELVEEWEIMGYGVQTEYGYTREEWNMMGKDWNFVTEGDDINIRVGAE